MSETKHTPGRWILVNGDEVCHEHEDSEGLLPTVCTVFKGDDFEGNAALILAAPDLLAALQQVKCPACNGKGTRHKYCSLCGDSTFDHECNDGDVPCDACDGTGQPPYVSAAIAKATGATKVEG